MMRNNPDPLPGILFVLALVLFVLFFLASLIGCSLTETWGDKRDEVGLEIKRDMTLTTKGCEELNMRIQSDGGHITDKGTESHGSAAEADPTKLLGGVE